jgi:hypothetical protein
MIASVASILRLKGWGAQTNKAKQVATFWQGELASLRIGAFGAWRPPGLDELLRIAPANIHVAKNRIFCSGIWHDLLVCSLSVWFRYRLVTGQSSWARNSSLFHWNTDYYLSYWDSKRAFCWGYRNDRHQSVTILVILLRNYIRLFVVSYACTSQCLPSTEMYVLPSLLVYSLSNITR